MEAHAPKRYSGVSDTTQKGETKMKQGDESQNPRCGTDFISGVSSCARLFSVFCRRIREKKLFLNWITVTIWCRFRKSDGSGFTAKKVGFLAAFLNLAGNVIGFLPFGFIVPVMHKKWRVSGKYRFLVLCSASAWRRFSSSRRWAALM